MGNIFQKFTKTILTTTAALEILKEKAESKALELAIQIKNFTIKGSENVSKKEKAKLELSELVNEIHHKAQINELQLKSFIKDKLTELTNNALLDSMELNDIRAEIATLRAELKDLKEELQLQKSKR